MLLQVLEAIILQVIVEPLLVVTVTTLYLTIMPRSTRPDELMGDIELFAKNIQRVDSRSVRPMRKLWAVIRLDDPGSVAKIRDSPEHKINRGIATVFLIGVDEALPCGLV